MLEDILRMGRRLIPGRLFSALQPFYHWFLGVMGAFWYGFPSRDMTVIGVTGTNGKSTVVNLIDAILCESGIKTASVSSIRFKIGEREWPNELKMTMPGRAALQKFLAQAKKEKATHAVIEVTSEGIRQFRHKNINWEILVFTNITPEHIESHGGFDAYRAAKLKLFQMPHQWSVINADDPSAELFFEKSIAPAKIGYGIKSFEAGHKNKLKSKVSRWVEASDVKLEAQHIEFRAEKEKFLLPLVGEFNVYNALVALSVAKALNISADKIKQAFVNFKAVPGRMEFINEDQPFGVVVDYAHTPDSLEKVYKTLREIAPSSVARPAKMICVLGSAGGGRDKWKRNKFGMIAAQNCDTVILTNEDPYDEDPQTILNEIEDGFLQAMRSLSKTAHFYKILDRGEAIKKAIFSAGAADTVIITGKGSESVIMGTRGSRIPWDDRREARKALSELRQREIK
ncbi:MAG: UDP-N-acetylmuramoyl-L-alanyl-D-glutamate--2,6-diaminopimelate ligase [Candidatus Niyogibacteria bacterium]|nr:UDP-N-acetylmuramoyl-L-alanyl-D-glutamate--2,6-diaminopimelate ligase [Candidatus Niyogibacteria bacterium]